MAAQQTRRQCILDSALLAAAATTGVASHSAMAAKAMDNDASRQALLQKGLRWAAPTALLPRMCSADTSLGGVDIAAGDWVLLGITAANNDPQVFNEPQRFDPERGNKNLAFGHGEHFCLGSHLARREMEAALKCIFERFADMCLSQDKEVKIPRGVLRGPEEPWVRPRGMNVA